MAKLPAISFGGKRVPEGLPKSLNCIGDYLKYEMIMRKLQQKELAEILGVSVWNLVNWQKRHTSIRVGFVAPIVEFLGYCPLLETPKHFGDKLRLARYYRGLSQEQAAREIGVDPSTWCRWERGYTNESPSPRDKFEKFCS